MNSILDRHYLELVDELAAKSKDSSTGIGAVVKAELGTTGGFNELPTGVQDSPERRERPAKYVWTEHAERNAIYAAAREGIATKGATLYTTGVPCADCARATIQSGIVRVVVWQRGSGLERTDRWYDSITAGRTMLLEAGIEINEIERHHE